MIFILINMKKGNDKLYSTQIIGDILLLKFSKDLSENEKMDIAERLKEKMKKIKTICEIKGIEGEFREPKIKILVGNDTTTIHKEHGILYSIDVSKLMFSKGNLYERNRIIKMVKENEVIVDMFSGIGYFSLGIAKYAKPKVIYAIEKNPVALDFLIKNIKLNRVEDKIIPILGDCRDIARQSNFQKIADRVIMGYLKNTQDFLESAFLFLRNEGVIHFHNTYKKEELWEKPIDTIEKFANENNYKIDKIISKRIVKSYAPKIYHVVLDVKLIKS